MHIAFGESKAADEDCKVSEKRIKKIEKYEAGTGYQVFTGDGRATWD